VNELRVVWMLARRSLRQTFRRPQLLAPVLVFPTLFLIANVGGAGSAIKIAGFPEVHGFLDFQLPAAMLQASLLVGVSGGIALALDIERGFIDRLIAAPISRSAVVTGRLGATAVLGAVVGLWFIAVGLIGGARIEGGVAGVLVVLVLLSLACIAFGGLGAALALRSGRASVVQGIFPLVFVILFLSSSFFPRELMQEPARSVAAWNPLTLIIDGLREPVIAGLSLGKLGTGLAGIAIVGVLAAALSAWGLRSRLRAA
jgi:ABC-type multidrug transport system permease subunit